eukprot:4284747-Amphidinium_carterae.1
MHGATRDKWSTLLHNAREFAVLGLKCDGMHVHTPFPVVRGSRDREFPGAYPLTLCRRLAACFAARSL